MSVLKIISKISLVLALFLLHMTSAGAQTFSKDSTEYEVNDYDAGYNAITMTPFTLPKGALVAQNLMLGINTLEYGLTDNLSIAAGISFFGVRDASNNPMGLLSIKYKMYDRDGIAVSISSLNAFRKFKVDPAYEEYYDPFESMHALFLNSAFYKDKNNFVSVGAGLYGSPGFISVIFTAGFSKRTSKTTAVIGDLWLPVFDLESDTTIFPFPAIGVRQFLESGITIDFGFPFIGVKIPLIKPAKNKKASN